MASNAPGECCYKGFKHEGTAVGEMGKIGEYETYFSYPKDKSTENAILFITDVIGHTSINAQLLADQLAANGYFVAMPDLFNNNPCPLNGLADGTFNLQEWLKGYGPEIVDPIIEASITELRTKYNVKKLGAVGYCFGGKYVIRYLRANTGKIDAGFIAHPSFVSVEEVEAIQGPLSIAAAETDAIFTTELRHKTEEILVNIKAVYQINLYSGVQHGFGVRSNPKDKVQKFASTSAFLQAVRWMDTHLKE